MRMGSRRHLLALSCGAVALAWAASSSAQTTGSPPPPKQPGTSRSDEGQRAAPTSQDTSAGSTSAVSEVVVTAASRATTIQHVDAAVTAFTDERRNLLGIENGRDISNLTPSMSLQGEYLTLRGVGRFEDPGQGLDPGVAVHVDGVYTSSPAYLGQPDFLTDRIEVLRGPQSVYGRNSVGGTVNIYSRRPTADLHGDLRLGGTTNELGYVDAAISGPITSTLGFRLGYAGSDTRSGPQDNVGGYANPATGATRLYEAQLEWQPNNDIDVWTRYQNFSSSLRPSYGVGAGIVLGGPYNTGTPATYTTNLYYGLEVNPQYGIDPNSNPQIKDPYKVSLDTPGHVNTKNDHTFTINATWNLHWAKLKYIGGYSQYDYDLLSDADQTARPFLTSPGGRQVPSQYTINSFQDKKWYSNELILTSPDYQRLRWVAGVYQYFESYKTTFAVEDPLEADLATPYSAVGGPLAAPNPSRAFYSQLTELRSGNQAIYGQLDYDLTKTFKLTGSLRYNWDQRKGYDTVREIFDIASIYGDFAAPLIALDVTPSPGAASAKADFSDWSGNVGAEWHPDRSIIAYVNIARGYKSGGFDLGNFRPIPIVQPETLTDYEFGLKKTFGRTLVLDAAAYYYDYKNLQVPITLGSTVTNPVTGVSSNIFLATLANAQRTHSIGFELESVYSPLENLHFTVIYSYLDSKFDKFVSPTPGGFIQDPAGAAYANLKGNTVPQAPKNKVSFIPNYVVHTGTGDISLSATYSWVAEQYYAIFNTSRYLGPSYYNLDLRAVYQPTKSPFTFLAYIRNVTDSRQYIYYSANSVFTNQNIYTLSENRTFGAEVQYRF